MRGFSAHRLAVVGFGIALVGLVAPLGAGEIAPDLQALLQFKSADEQVSTLLFLKDRVDVVQLDQALEHIRAPRGVRHEVVVRALQSTAARSQSDLVARLAALEAAGEVSCYEPFWVANAIRVDAPPATIRELAADPAVEVAYINYPVTRDPEVSSGPASGGTDNPIPSLVVLNVPQVWALGIDGTGVLVSGLDTGVDGSHPALASRWRGLDPRYVGHPQWAWMNAIGGEPIIPHDGNGHGTHLMGTICGGAPGEQIGIAPGAQWIACDAINQSVGPMFLSDVFNYCAWTIDPDGDPGTVWDVPAISANGWSLSTGLGYPPCDPMLWNALDAVEAAGVAVVFTAGGNGPAPNSITRPGDRAVDDFRTLAVGAVDTTTSGWPVASFSGRGPTYCTPTGDAAIKPNIVGPGIHILSALPGGDYGMYDGTATATAHICGVLTLIRAACPDLSVQEAKQIMYETARDLGAAGEDNNYGWGLPDALAAVNLAIARCPRAGDLNCDGVIDFDDINPFVLALSDPAGYEAAYPGCNISNGDCNGDGLVDFDDINAFVALLSG